MNATRYKCSVLVVDDDPAVLALLVAQLGQDFETLTAGSAEQARGQLAQRSVDILLTDLGLPDESGVRLLEWARRTVPRTARVLISGTVRLEDAVDAVNQSQVHRLVLKPWRPEDLVQTLRATSRGLMLERSHEQLLDELRKLNLDLEKRVEVRTAELQAVLHQLQQKNQILEKMALTDPLTGLPNRRAIDLIAGRSCCGGPGFPPRSRWASSTPTTSRRSTPPHLLSGGDHALKSLGAVLLNSVRETDSIGRVGGEEFMVVAPGTDAAGVATLAERIRSNVEAAAAEFNGRPIRITVSIGFAIAPPEAAVTYDQLREAAAAGLKQAKDDGRNRAVVRPAGRVP